MANLIRRNEQSPQPQPRELMPRAWEPLRLMRDLMALDPFADMLSSVTSEAMAFTPRFEVRETKDAYVFHADLPGIDDKDLDISLNGNRLTVSGKREAVQHQESDTYYAYERSYGSFSRSFTLPDGADTDHADAELKSGVLTLSIPKKPEHQPRKISLKGIGEKVKSALGGSKEKGSA